MLADHLSIGPGGPPAADFSIASLTAGRSLDGMPTVIASVTNTGGRALDITGALDLRSPSGDLHAGPYPADLGATLAIGATEPVTITTRADLPPPAHGKPRSPCAADLSNDPPLPNSHSLQPVCPLLCPPRNWPSTETVRLRAATSIPLCRSLYSSLRR